jgi:ribosomal protein S12 methylthiotransferase accessory factor YcaO
MWSGGVEANGLWFQDDSATYTEAAWIEDWVMLAQRYANRPWVVAYDLRNEVGRALAHTPVFSTLQREIDMDVIFVMRKVEK